MRIASYAPSKWRMGIAFSILKWFGLGVTGMLGGLQGIAFQALTIATLVGGAYVKGRIDCSAIHATAGLQATIAAMQARAEAAEAANAEWAALANKEEKDAKKTDDAIDRAKAVAERPIRAGVCATSNFLRKLNAAR